MSNRLFVGNLDYETTSEDLRELFTGAGEVVSAKVIADRDTQRSRGFAFIEMADEETARKAIAMFNGHVLNDRALAVSEARPQEPRPIGDRPSRGDYGPRRDDYRGGKHKRRGGRQQRRY